MENDCRPNTAIRSSGELVDAVARSGVLSEEQVQQLSVRAQSHALPGDPLHLANDLVNQQILTNFQAKRLLTGRADSLVIGRYTLLEKVGSGSMGRVYKARHQLMDRVVALKVISPRRAQDPRLIERFVREMKLVGKLEHRNVVRAYDAGVERNTPFIVMEFLTGENLELMARERGALPHEQIVDFIAQAARGLAHAHDRGVVHCDIKPSNMHVDGDGTVKILDLGLGGFVESFTDSAGARHADRRVAGGTADYMSPEQISGEPLDARTDLYSLGCSLFRLLTGAYPFSGKTQWDRLRKRISEQPIPLQRLRPDLPADLVQIVDRLLARQPDGRYASATETAEVLEAWLAEERAARAVSRSDGTNGASKTASPFRSEPDLPPLNSSLIEAAIAPNDITKWRPPGSGQAHTHTPPPGALSVNDLDSHRKDLEAEGTATGREVHRQYYAEVAELRRADPEASDKDDDPDRPSIRERWLERLGERLGDLLADPSTTQMLLVVLGIALLMGLVLALAFAVA
jgi:serine/threonine-protein kinase